MAKKVSKEKSKELVATELAPEVRDRGDVISRNKKLFIGLGAVIVLAVGGYFFWRYQTDTKNAEAQTAMFKAVYYFEADSLDKALNGDGNNEGLLDIHNDYSGTEASNLASYYIGVIYLKKGKYQEAVDYLTDFKSSDLILQGRAYSLLGDAHMEMNKPKEAAEHYREAANYKPNKYFSPGYLMKLALALEKSGDKKGASEAYQKIIDEYFDAAEVPQAKKYKALLEGADAK